MVEELWIINRDGICFFHRSINKNIDSDNIKNGFKIEEQLFGGFLSGILSFSSHVTSDNIEKIEMSEGKFLFFTNKDLIFIIKTKLNTSDSKIRKKINLIEELFIKKFEKELNNFNGEIASFQVFEKDLDDVFKKISKSDKWAKGLLDL